MFLLTSAEVRKSFMLVYIPLLVLTPCKGFFLSLGIPISIGSVACQSSQSFPQLGQLTDDCTTVEKSRRHFPRFAQTRPDGHVSNSGVRRPKSPEEAADQGTDRKNKRPKQATRISPPRTATNRNCEERRPLSAQNIAGHSSKIIKDGP